MTTTMVLVGFSSFVLAVKGTAEDEG